MSRVGEPTPAVLGPRRPTSSGPEPGRGPRRPGSQKKGPRRWTLAAAPDEHGRVR